MQSLSDIYEKNSSSAEREVFGVLPSGICEAITAIRRLRRDVGRISEIRLRAGDVSFIVSGGKSFPIRQRISGVQIKESFDKITEGCMHLHEGELSSGFVSMSFGVRVGVVADARLDNNTLSRVEKIRGLIFRFPFFAPEIGRAVADAIMCGGELCSSVIYSAPGVGKTTALRSLPIALASMGYTRVVIVDERYEFPCDAYLGIGADVIRGYSKPAGIEIAARLLNPEVIIADEIGNRAEAMALMDAVNIGIPIIISAHGERLSHLLLKEGVGELIKRGGIQRAVSVKRKNTDYIYESEDIELK